LSISLGPPSVYSCSGRGLGLSLSHDIVVKRAPPWDAERGPEAISLLAMPQGGKRPGAGRPLGSGNGRTVEIRSISMPPQTWEKLDELRGVARDLDRLARLERLAAVETARPKVAARAATLEGAALPGASLSKQLLGR
jgi:hypothetical protein